MALSDRPIQGGALIPVIIAGTSPGGNASQVEILVDGAVVAEANPIPSTEAWRVSLIADELDNDSDKTFTVPALTEYQILWIWVELTTTATVGNRQMVIQVQDSASDVISTWALASVVQAASIARNYLFAPGVADQLGFRDTSFLTTPIPVTSFLQAGDIIRVYDNKAIDAAADDMIVQMKIASRLV
jgi:hypothetical protein